MARRIYFKNIASGLIGSFISRNNDVLGYWGIGKLYSHMLLTKTMQIDIDLINRTMTPYSNEFDLLINDYSNRLLNKMSRLGMHQNYMTSAKIILKGFMNDRPSIRYAPHKMNCTVVIVDDLNRKHKLSVDVWCREHNKLKEFKSTRG